MTDSDKTRIARQEVLIRVVVSVVLILCFAVAETVVVLVTVLQALWMLVTGERNPRIARFGERLAHWLAVTARFQSGASEVKPFPWTDW